MYTHYIYNIYIYIQIYVYMNTCIYTQKYLNISQYSSINLSNMSQACPKIHPATPSLNLPNMFQTVPIHVKTPNCLKGEFYKQCLQHSNTKGLSADVMILVGYKSLERRVGKILHYYHTKQTSWCRVMTPLSHKLTTPKANPISMSSQLEQRHIENIQQDIS